ncbi:MAG: T9SS type A sorting domain-containing protein [bacterium]
MPFGKIALPSLGILLLAAMPLAAQEVCINEILYDTPGADNPALLFTELWGPPGTSLSGWSLVGISGATGESYITVRLSGTIPQDGYFVIANCGDSSYVDLDLELGCEASDSSVGVDWRNAGGPDGDDCDGIELRHGTEVVDKVCYGLCAPGHSCNGEGGTNAPDAYPAGGFSYSIARCPDHEDSDDNGSDWAITFPTPGRLNECPCRPYYFTLSQVQEDEPDGTPLHEGEFVSVRGVANVANNTFDPERTDFFIQSETAGIEVFGSFEPIAIALGDCVLVEGWLAHSCGLCQIVDFGTGLCFPVIEIVDHAAPPEPVLLNCRSVSLSGETYEGMLAKIECVTIVGGDPWPAEGQDATITVADGSGLCTIRIDKDTDIDGRPEPDAPITAIGIVIQRDSTLPFTENYCLLPRAYGDISICSSADVSPALCERGLRLIGCHPNPFNASVQLSFTVTHAGIVSLHIFDLLGRKVAQASIYASGPGEYGYRWDGRNPAGESVSAGLYFVRVKSGTETAVGKIFLVK